MISEQKDRVTSLSNANARRNWIWWRRTWMEQRWQIQRVFSVRKTTMPAKTSVLLYLVNIVICARNFKHGRTDNQFKKQEPKTCSIRWGWISLAKKGWSGKGGTSAGRRRRGEQHQEIIPRKITWRAGYSDQQYRKPFKNPRIQLHWDSRAPCY